MSMAQLQKAIFQKVNAYVTATLTETVGGGTFLLLADGSTLEVESRVEGIALANAIYSNKPQDAEAEAPGPFPYITFAGSDSAGPFDSKSFRGRAARVQFQVYSRSGDWLEVKTISDGLIAAIRDEALTVPGASYVMADLAGEGYFRDPDGTTLRSVITLDILYTEA